jgi:hypothetical protein
MLYGELLQIVTFSPAPRPCTSPAGFLAAAWPCPPGYWDSFLAILPLSLQIHSNMDPDPAMAEHSKLLLTVTLLGI